MRNLKIILFGVILFLLNIPSVHGQNPVTYDTTYFQSSALFKCLISFPDNYSPQDSYPLVIGLHSGGETPEQFITIWNGLNKTEFIYAVPQAPYSWLMGEAFGYEWSLWPTGNEDLMERAALIAEGYVADLIKDLTKRYNVSEVYLLGFSQGAILAYRAGIKNYRLIDGLICLSGPGLSGKLWSPFSDSLQVDWLPDKFIKEANSLRVFIANGDEDKYTPVEIGIKSRNILAGYGYDVKFYSFGGGHTINKEILKLVVEWINNK